MFFLLLLQISDRKVKPQICFMKQFYYYYFFKFSQWHRIEQKHLRNDKLVYIRPNVEQRVPSPVQKIQLLHKANLKLNFLITIAKIIENNSGEFVQVFSHTQTQSQYSLISIMSCPWLPRSWLQLYLKPVSIGNHKFVQDVNDELTHKKSIKKHAQKNRVIPNGEWWHVGSLQQIDESPSITFSNMTFSSISLAVERKVDIHLSVMCKPPSSFPTSKFCVILFLFQCVLIGKGEHIVSIHEKKQARPQAPGAGRRLGPSWFLVLNAGQGEFAACHQSEPKNIYITLGVSYQNSAPSLSSCNYLPPTCMPYWHQSVQHLNTISHQSLKNPRPEWPWLSAMMFRSGHFVSFQSPS